MDKPSFLHTIFSRTERPSSPFVVAGPCSAESETQLLQTATAVARLPVALFRAGVWKPRTQPGTFEGRGEPALQWLQQVKTKTGLPVATEVASPRHVELALRYGIDVLWIGARTSVNPFLVQEIADALRGTAVPVMVKNPISPDQELWIGAIERIRRAGITQVAAIHRGFSVYERMQFRNNPLWEIPIELRRRIPDLFMICDPSHICGTRDLIKEVSQKALDIGFDGLMIETHVNPDEALSDKQQQIIPETLEKILSALLPRTAATIDTAVTSRITELRKQIDSLDESIVELLASRMKLAEEIGKYKKENNIAILQPHRWNEIIETRTKHGRHYLLDQAFIFQLFRIIHQEAIQRQTE